LLYPERCHPLCCVELSSGGHDEDGRYDGSLSCTPHAATHRVGCCDPQGEARDLLGTLVFSQIVTFVAWHFCDDLSRRKQTRNQQLFFIHP
jgi:hypothetical protein